MGNVVIKLAVQGTSSTTYHHSNLKKYIMEIIKIYQGSLVDARELHQFLESRQDFSTWIKSRIKKYDFIENEDYSLAPQNYGASWGGQNKIDYLLTLTMAKELAMVENTEKGKQARRYFIECEKTLVQLRNNKRLTTFFKLEATKERLLKNIKGIGGNHDDFIQIDYTGRKILFNGKPIPDEQLPLILLKGRDFATEMTNEQFKEDDLTLDDVEKLNEHHHQEVREMLIENIRKTPESIKPEKDIKKLQQGEDENEGEQET